MTVGLTMIVKNEEKHLARCLESVRYGVDEIVIVDTGSTDRTKAVAAQYDARIFDFPWCDDFGAARQFALDQAKSDWVVWLDADDVLTGAQHIRPSIERFGADVKGFFWRYVIGREPNGDPAFVYWRERCVRNDGSFRWVGIVHEVLVGAQSWRTERIDDIVVEHHRDPNREGNSRRNLAMLERQYDVAGGQLEPRMLFYFGRELADHGEFERAIEILERYHQVAVWPDEHYHGRLRLAQLYSSKGDAERAIDVYLSALKIYPQWPDAYFELAAIYYYRKDWLKVIHWIDVGKSLPLPNTLLFVNRRALEYDWLIYYTNALYHSGRVHEALQWTEHALSIRADDNWHLQNRLFFLESLGKGYTEVVFEPQSSEDQSAIERRS